MRQIGNKKSLVLQVEYDERGEGGFGISDPVIRVPGDDANRLVLASMGAVWQAVRKSEERHAKVMDRILEADRARSAHIEKQNHWLLWLVGALLVINLTFASILIF